MKEGITRRTLYPARLPVVCVPKQLRSALDMLANKRNITLANLMRQILTDYIKNISDYQDLKKTLDEYNQNNPFTLTNKE